MNMDSQLWVDTASGLSLSLLMLSAVLVFIRLVKGPQAADRDELCPVLVPEGQQEQQVFDAVDVDALELRRERGADAG